MRDDKALHAYLDGELDAAASLELERAMAENPALRASYERMRELSAAVREKADYHPAPVRFEVSARRPRTWMLAPAFAMVLLAGIGLGVFLAQPRDDEALGADVVASHVRATLAGRLVDVPSSDQHTVKPWLSARLPFSPPVADLSQEGYALTGARLDYVAGQSVAVLVYKRREHVIDVFVSPAAREAAPSASARDGFNVARFARGGMRYWIVSDLNRNELDDFAKLLAR
ncbi:MAG: anti-sigma factor [Betaproteobacteria bacterium]|nr:MAG: anti-sigma factor [Betaproteobacteria bacterium]